MLNAVRITGLRWSESFHVTVDFTQPVPSSRLKCGKPFINTVPRSRVPDVTARTMFLVVSRPQGQEVSLLLERVVIPFQETPPAKSCLIPPPAGSWQSLPAPSRHPVVLAGCTGIQHLRQLPLPSLSVSVLSNAANFAVRHAHT